MPFHQVISFSAIPCFKMKFWCISLAAKTAFASIIFLILTSTTAFGTKNNASNPFSKLQNKIAFPAGLERKLLLKYVIPSYLQDFMKLSYSIDNSNGKNRQDNFFQKLFNEVTNEGCKDHVAEWLWRMDNLENAVSEKDKWVLQSKL